MDSIDVRLAAAASNHHGVITLIDALAAGLNRSQVKYRVRSGRWQRVGNGVFRLAGVPETWQQRALIACLGAPDGATASHLTAAALAGLGEPPPTPHITVGTSRSSRVPGVIVHRARLGPVDHQVVQGVPTTTVARTLVDCAALLGPRRLQRLVDTAFHRRLVTPDQVAEAWDQARLRPGRAGEVRLRDALEPWGSPIRPGSPAEVRLQRQIVEWGYPEPARQVPVVDDTGTTIGRIDLGWAERRLGIEYDGEEYHGPSRWRHDEARHRALTELGWTILRSDKSDLLPGATALRLGLARAWLTTAVR